MLFICFLWRWGALGGGSPFVTTFNIEIRIICRVSFIDADVYVLKLLALAGLVARHRIFHLIFQLTFVNLDCFQHSLRS